MEVLEGVNGMNREICELLKKVYPLENEEKCRKRFVGRRFRNTAAAAVAMVSFPLATTSRPAGEGKIGEGGRVARPEFGSSRLELLAECGGTVRPVEFELPARRRSQEEVQELLDRAEGILGERILGDNPSLQEVTGDLVLLDSLAEYDIEIEWKTGNRELISGDGSVHNMELKQPQEVTLTARMYYGETVRECDYYVCVQPYPYTQEELLLRELYEEIETCGEETAKQHYIKLPESLNGNEIVWQEEKGNILGIVVLLGIVLIAAVYSRESVALRKKKREREEEMLIDYPEFLSRFILLTGAGMTVRAAWEHMLSDYKKSGRKRYVYDEMKHTMAQLEVGMPELRAYEEFGRRCALLPYLRFTTILTQNLKKGSAGIAALLRMESEEAFSERKNQARRKGEEAGTKLLLPMGGMLLIVFVLILVPAFASFPV